MKDNQKDCQKDYQIHNKSFQLYKDWEELFDALDTDEEAGKLIKALFAFAKRGEETEFKGALKMAFVIMSQRIDSDGEKWEETRKQRIINGKKGGRPSKATESVKAENNQQLF